MRQVSIARTAIPLTPLVQSARDREDRGPRFRLHFATRLYRYCPIPPVEYPQLTEELFGRFYCLRHLRDESRFPRDWPIRDQV